MKAGKRPLVVLVCGSRDWTDGALIGEWQKHGNCAGPIRNQEMLDAERPDVVLAFTWACPSPPPARPEVTRGTGDMVCRAVAAGVRVTIIPPRIAGPRGEL